MTALAPLLGDGFRLKPRREGSRLVVEFSGSVEHKSHDELQAFFRRLHAEAQRVVATQVTLDVRQLEFVDSSCFNVFVVWIDSLNRLAPLVRYRIRFLRDPNRRWQIRGFDALKHLCLTHITIEDWQGIQQ